MKQILLVLFLLLSTIIIKAQSPQLWATCMWGGDLSQGTIIKSDSSGENFHVVYSFDGPNGAAPLGGLCNGGNGKLYGVTEFGGFADSCVVFSYDTLSGIYSRFHDLAFHPVDSGDGAASGMLRASDGMLYGMTAYGGLNNGGVIYRVDPSIDTYSPIYHFEDSTGNLPLGEFIQLQDGYLYGMALSGGQDNGGVIFRFNPTDSSYTVLYNFSYSSGEHPYYGRLLMATDGKLYGLTVNGGQYGVGVIFSYDIQNDTYSDLHDFDTASSDGANPYSSLTQGNNGLLYGMTSSGGINNKGVIFKYDINAQHYSIVFNFTDSSGYFPTRSLTQGSNGKLFGTTTYSLGGYGGGTAFSFDPSTGTFVKLIDFNSIGCFSPSCDILETGVDVANAVIPTNQTSHSQVSLYPNPAKDDVTVLGNVLTPETQIEIYNNQSKRVYDFTWKGNTMNVSGLSPGLYVLKIKERNEVVVGKFVKQ